VTTDLVEVVRERFRIFSSSYLEGTGSVFAYKIKIEHTYKVLERATDICHGDKLGQVVTLASRLAALLHDVGRFPQYHEFKTFRDCNSVNHAALSVRHLLRENMLEGVPIPIRRLATGAVFLHNVRFLPHNLSPEMLATVQVVRDSDKLDILRVMLEHFGRAQQEAPEVTLEAKDHPTNYTPAIAQAILNRQVSDYKSIVWVNDFKLLIAGWLYDLNTRTACCILRNSGHLDALFALLPQDETIGKVHAQIMSDLAQRVNGD